MKIARVALVLAGLFLASGAPEAEAAKITSIELGQGSYAILMVGDITAEDAERFKVEAGKHDRAIVLLESEGGSTLAAISIGQVIRLRGYSTAVINGSDCNSACALIWLAGSPRKVSKSGRIGFHATYTESAGRQSESGVGNAMVGRYLTLLNLPEKALIFATSASPSELNYLTAANYVSTGIDAEIIDDIDLDRDKSSPPPLVAQSSAPMPGYWFTGNQLYTFCTTREGDSAYYMNTSQCRGFIQGIDDGASLTRWSFKQQRAYCVPSEATAGQIKDIVVKELQDNPADRNLPAAAIVLNALRKAFPC